MAITGFQKPGAFQQALLKALDLEGKGVRKVVIECDVNKIVTAYVVLIPEEKGLLAACEEIRVVGVKDVTVADDATVVVQE